MLALLWLVPVFPLSGFLVLAVIGKRLARVTAAVIGVGVIGCSALISLLIGISYLASPPSSGVYTQELWEWIRVSSFRPAIAFYLDPLSLVMMLVVTCVSFLIHLYSTEFMSRDEGYSRFFAYMNLFVASMIILLLADNLLLLYLGWEGVGLCSYLLIGFWYREPVNGRAACKAFIVTRVGDTAMAVGLFLLFTHLGTLQIQELMGRAANQWPTGSPLAIAAAALLLGGAVGKSAQLPLQVWLPDAMAGPTPTSALIHAATMVTAGVYLIARIHVLYTLAPQVQLLVAWIGAATLLLAGFSAATQSDIKRVLAYSTISQIGYMFLALGVGAWSAAIFHFVTHAFFKALLFLAAGIIIEALHHEHDIFKMGGLRTLLPGTFWAFMIGGCSLAGLPLVTAGFFSKGLIIWQARASQHGGGGLWLAAIIGVLLTAIYTFRLIFLVFWGEPKTHVERHPGLAENLPLYCLSFLSLVGGYLNTPAYLGDIQVLTRFLSPVLPGTTERQPAGMSELGSEACVALALTIGLLTAWILFLRRRDLAAALVSSGPANALDRLWSAGWGFDWLYDHVFVRPVLWLAAINRADMVDRIYDGAARLARCAHGTFSRTQTGQVRWYAAGIALGSIILMAWVILS